MAKRVTDVWAGGKATRGITQKHRALLWENMLGTVRSRNPDGEVRYHDYDYEAAHAWIELDKYTDLRVCRAKYETQDGPRAGRFALYGIYQPTTK